MDTILTSADGNHRVVSYITHDAEMPRWGAEVGVIYAEHPRYTLGDPHTGLAGDVARYVHTHGLSETLAWLREEHGATVALPLYLYDHSGISISAGANLLDGGEIGQSEWDTSVVGLIFDTETTREGTGILGDVEDVLRGEIRDYDLYLRGEVYTLEVQERITEAIFTTRIFPGGRVESTERSRVVWESVPDGEHVTTYGDDEHGQIAADLLLDFEGSN